jgi:hypothetical protein
MKAFKFILYNYHCQRIYNNNKVIVHQIKSNVNLVIKNLQYELIKNSLFNILFNNNYLLIL